MKIISKLNVCNFEEALCILKGMYETAPKFQNEHKLIGFCTWLNLAETLSCIYILLVDSEIIDSDPFSFMNNLIFSYSG